MKTITLLFVTLTTLTLSGCGSGGAVVSGTVKYKDGTPVVQGTVVFDSASQTFLGSIQPDGSYSAASSSGGGIPFGSYRVWLSGTETIENEMGIDSSTGAKAIAAIRTFPTVAKQYTSPDTSGLTIEVKSSGKQTFDLTVEKPVK